MDISEQLIKAAKNGNAKEVRKLLSRGAVFTKDEFGNTALHEASWTGNQDIAKILLKANCFVDSVNVSGFAPLHMACQNGHAKVAKTLLKWKATATLRNQHDEAPLHIAAKYDHAQMIPVFAAAKADLNVKAKDENTPLHIAAKLGNLATVKALIQGGADPNISNKKAKLPIDYAEIGDYHSTVKILIPFTERIKPKRQTMDSSRCVTPTELSSRPRSKSFFNKAKPKDMWATPTQSALLKKQGADSPHSLHEVELRKKSKSFTPVQMKRYSRELEDLPLKSGTHVSTSMLPDHTAASHSSSLEDLLEEIEIESRGPDYKYVPPSSDESEDNLSVGYKSIHRMSPSLTNRPLCRTPTPPTNRPLCRTPTPPTKCISPTLPIPLVPTTPRPKFSATPSPLSSPLQPTKNPLYDYLTPATGTCSTRDSIISEGSTSIGERSSAVFSDDGSYVSLTPSGDMPTMGTPIRDTLTRGTPIRDTPTTEGSLENIYSHPVLSDDIINHCYEYLPPLKDDAGEGFDSYVYMAPKTKSIGRNTSFTKEASPSPLVNSKRAAVVSAEYRNDPLTTTQKHNSASELECYLKDELDSMKQVFQTRLSQVEKKYHQQMSVQGPHPQSPSIRGKLAATPLYQNVFTQRVSWHGDTQDTEQDTQDPIPEPSPPQSSVANDDDGLNDVTKKLIEQKLEEYKKEMMEMFLEKAKSMEKTVERSPSHSPAHSPAHSRLRKESIV